MKSKSLTKEKKNESVITANHFQHFNCIKSYGLFLLIMGIIMLLKEIGILDISIDLWPLIIIGTGTAIICKKVHPHCS
ncbi:MAG: hypothetical protein KKF44_05780 [Nanoarchaeota archaeon]|nr:hypothetical protein [Nanoarchaeota archaeon]